MRAIWNGSILADSDDTVEVEGNHYFPASAVRMEFMQPSDTHTTCPWKGQASYFTVQVGGDTNPDAAWYYPEPREAAQQIRGRIAFWRGIEITE